MDLREALRNVGTVVQLTTEIVLDAGKTKLRELGAELKEKGRQALRDFLNEDDRDDS